MVISSLGNAVRMFLRVSRPYDTAFPQSKRTGPKLTRRARANLWVVGFLVTTKQIISVLACVLALMAPGLALAQKAPIPMPRPADRMPASAAPAAETTV